MIDLGIGMVIAHEITHGFDDTSRQFDKDGNRIVWWTDQTIEKFNDRKQYIIDQYSNYTVSKSHMKVFIILKYFFSFFYHFYYLEQW